MKFNSVYDGCCPRCGATVRSASLRSHMKGEECKSEGERKRVIARGYVWVGETVAEAAKALGQDVAVVVRSQRVGRRANRDKNHYVKPWVKAVVGCARLADSDDGTDQEIAELRAAVRGIVTMISTDQELQEAVVALAALGEGKHGPMIAFLAQYHGACAGSTPEAEQACVGAFSYTRKVSRYERPRLVERELGAGTMCAASQSKDPW